MDESGKLFIFFVRLRWHLICCKSPQKIQRQKSCNKKIVTETERAEHFNKNEIESDFENCELWKSCNSETKNQRRIWKKNQFSEPSWVFKYVAVIDCANRKNNAGGYQSGKYLVKHCSAFFLDLDFQQCHVVIPQSMINLKLPRVDKHKVHRKFSKQCQQLLLHCCFKSIS